MIRILVDSTSDFAPAECEARNITMVPLSVNFGDDSFLDVVEMDKEEFYDRLVNGDVHPKTSQPAPAAFLEAFEEAKEKGDELICIMLSGAISGTYQNAVNAKMMSEYEKIHVIDSCSTSAAIRIMADYAEKLIGWGLSAEEIVERLEELKGRVRILAALDTLEYLQKGGRLSKAAAAIGTMASLKPVITLTREGDISVQQKCLGKARAQQYLLDQMKKVELDEDFPLYSLYTYGTENCEKMEDNMLKIGLKPEQRIRISSVIGTHVGPEVYGMIYVVKK